MGDSGGDISVMVIGAGSGGRLIAQGLRKAGIHCTVFEQDSSLDERSRDWDFGIYWSQTPLNECLPENVQSKIITAQVDNIVPTEDAFLPIFHGATGELMHKIPTPYYLRLRRREFARILGTDLDIRYSKRLVSVDATSSPGVIATFADGTKHTASLLIGAEGAHSCVREYLLGPEKGRLLYSPFVLSVAISKLPVDKALELLIHNAYDKPNVADYEFIFMTGWKQPDPLSLPDSRAIVADMKQRAEALAEPLRSIIAAIDDGSTAWSGYSTYWPTQGWEEHPSRGKVTLAGDAAHPMTPNRGQGLNNAVLDSYELVKQVGAMSERTIDALRGAVVRYEEMMWKRGKEAVMSSLENSEAVYNWEKLKQSPLFTKGSNFVVELDTETNDGSVVDRFLRKHHLYWLEASSLLDTVYEAEESMKKLEKMLKV
ncbi:FAD-dependent urate hydroxylase [Cytospora mali]|uniref:FAD-dependent urate hydroxylase n=1 Tax=Cytospora mali TaxID=578113 RepID=A0A194VK77_CYTMA|nr:FAD-dependent urate hydroxylase [Valsa mali]